MAPLQHDGARPPIVWVPNRNDETVSADGVIETYDRYIDNGGDNGLLLVNEPSPMLPGHFTRIPGVTCEISERLRTAYARHGIIDADGYIIESPRYNQAWRRAIPERLRSHNGAIGPLLHELYSNHFGVTGEYADAMFDYWLAR